MNLRAFEYLLALENHGSFNKAAESCNVSQPALSIQLKKLEEELEVKLLERAGKEFIFTECGKQLLERAATIMEQVAEVQKLAQIWQDPYGGSLSIGSFPTLAPFYFPLIVDHLVDSYPNLQFNLVEEKTDVLLDMLKTGRLDIAFLALPIDDKKLEIAELFTEEFKLGVQQEHPLASYESLPSEKCITEELLLLDDGHCLRDQALTYCSAKGINEVLNFRASSMATLLQMIRIGRGISLIPECVAQRAPSIHYVSLSPNPPTRTIGLVWRKTSPRRDLILELADDLKSP